jgi:hypothetical protein
MRFKFLCAGAIALMVRGLAFAQDATRPEPSKIQLRGDRFKPLTWETLAPDQKIMVNDVLSATRTSLNGPFNVLLRSPEMGKSREAVPIAKHLFLEAAPSRILII